MTTIVILEIVFVAMILLPLIMAWTYYKTSEGVVLKIQQDKVRDPRYFSHSFRKMIQKALPNIKGNTIMLSKEEHFHKPEDILTMGDSIDEMVLAVDEGFTFPENAKTYSKEVYADKEVSIANPGINVRAVYSGTRMLIGNKTKIDRWADAEETLAVYDDCDLGMAATAGKVLTVGKNVRFRRLYAPVIYIGQYPSKLIDPMEGRDELTFMLPIIHEKKNQKHVTHENMTDKGTAPYSIVTTKTMLVENAILQGDIHSDGSVRICQGAGVLGNVFAEKGILIEKGSFVVGNVFSQGKIEIRENVMIGRKGRIISVISRDKMIIGENTVIYGYVSSETEGRSCPIYDSEAPRYSGEYEFAPYTQERVEATFKNLDDYLSTDDMAYRMNPDLVSVVIPDGAESIRRSMFCGCENLQKLYMPKSLKQIQDYGLSDCSQLDEITSFMDTSIEDIGVSGLENCQKIKELLFPKSLIKLGPSSCAGLTSLYRVRFEEGSLLKDVGEHSFRDCTKLKNISLPDSVEKVGISAFRGCTGLRKISVSEKLKSEPGIAELKEILPKVKVEFREEVTSA